MGQGDGLVTIDSVVQNPDPDNQYDHDWSAADELDNLSTEVDQFVFDPALLTAGVLLDSSNGNSLPLAVDDVVSIGINQQVAKELRDLTPKSSVYP